MWIEVNLKMRKITLPEEYEEGTDWRALLDSDKIVGISPCEYPEGTFYIEVTYVTGTSLKLETYCAEANEAVYQGFMLAVKGQRVHFDQFGYIKPLLSERREALHKHLLYTETLNDLSQI